MKRFLYPLAYAVLSIYWQVFKPKTQGVKVIIESGGKILMIKNSYGGVRWNLPGGGVDKGETALDAALREAREEVGIQVDETTIQEIGSYVTTHEGKIDTVHVFHGFTTQDSEIDNDEIVQAAWFSRDALPEQVATQAQKSLALWDAKTPR